MRSDLWLISHRVRATLEGVFPYHMLLPNRPLAREDAPKLSRFGGWAGYGPGGLLQVANEQGLQREKCLYGPPARD
jgi:hypothetical protein